MKKCVLIGGYTPSKDGDDVPNVIDQKIVELAGKEKPVFLFIGLASSHSDSQYDKVKKIYQKLNCTTVYLKKNNLIHNPDLVKKKIKQADIIYIGGGDSIKLASRIKITICPHYGEDKKRICQLKESIRNTKTKVYGISNDASLVIINDQIEVISFNRGKVFQISYDNTYKESKVK